MRIFFALGVLGFIFISCSQFKREESKASFTMKSFSIASSGCSTDSSTCATYDLTYPEFNQLDTTVQTVLRNHLIKVISGAPIDGRTKSFEDAGRDFVADYDKTKAELSEYGMSWYYKGDAQVLFISDSMISIQADADVFTGGAHGMFSTTFLTIDPKTGALYLLDSFLKPGYQNLLNQLGEEEFRKELDMADTTTLDAAGFEFPENRFQLNENYGFRKEGIVFVFNSYEIAAYAMGPTEIVIPYEKLKGWFK